MVEGDGRSKPHLLLQHWVFASSKICTCKKALNVLVPLKVLDLYPDCRHVWAESGQLRAQLRLWGGLCGSHVGQIFGLDVDYGEYQRARSRPDVGSRSSSVTTFEPNIFCNLGEVLSYELFSLKNVRKCVF